MRQRIGSTHLGGHHIVPGHTDQSYGIHVAQLAGVPREVVDRARDILAHLEENAVGPDEQPRFAPRREDVPSPRQLQMPLFKPLDAEVREQLLSLDTESMTPVEALRVLDQILRRLRGKGG